jgi:MOSC domain-containing protein
VSSARLIACGVIRSRVCAIEEAFVGFAGVYGDRLFAFRDSANPKGFPYLTGREQQEMVLYRPRFRYPEKAARPPNLTDAEGIEPGLTPLFAAPEELAVDVETPSGELYRVDDPALLSLLYDRLGEGHTLTLLRSDRSSLVTSLLMPSSPLTMWAL